MHDDRTVDLQTARDRLSGKRGQDYWRSLEELAASDGFEEMLHREFPRQAAEWNDATGRRQFLQLMGASLALAGVSGCSIQPVWVPTSGCSCSGARSRPRTSSTSPSGFLDTPRPSGRMTALHAFLPAAQRGFLLR